MSHVKALNLLGQERSVDFVGVHVHPPTPLPSPYQPTRCLRLLRVENTASRDRRRWRSSGCPCPRHLLHAGLYKARPPRPVIYPHFLGPDGPCCEDVQQPAEASAHQAQSRTLAAHSCMLHVPFRGMAPGSVALFVKGLGRRPHCGNNEDRQ